MTSYIANLLFQCFRAFVVEMWILASFCIFHEIFGGIAAIHKLSCLAPSPLSFFADRFEISNKQLFYSLYVLQEANYTSCLNQLQRSWFQRIVSKGPNSCFALNHFVWRFVWKMFLWLETMPNFDFFKQESFRFTRWSKNFRVAPKEAFRVFDWKHGVLTISQ